MNQHIKIGDLVRFVDEPIEGHITSILPNNMVGVTDETGFEIPVLKDKITLVHGNMHSPEDDVPATPKQQGVFIEKGIFIGITGEQKDGLARFHIVNETSYELLIAVSDLQGKKSTGIYANIVPPKEHHQFYTANFSSINKWPTFSIQILRTSRNQINITAVIETTIKIKALDLINPKEQSQVLSEKSWLFELDKIPEDLGLDKLKDHFISHRPKK